MEYISGTTRFIACTHLAVTTDTLEKPLELREIVRQAVNARRRIGACWEDGNGDGLLVHIHPEIDDRASTRNDFGN